MPAIVKGDQPASPTLSMASLDTKDDTISSTMPDSSDHSPLLPPVNQPYYGVPANVPSPPSPTMTDSSWSVVEGESSNGLEDPEEDMYTMSGLSFDSDPDSNEDDDDDDADSISTTGTIILPDELTICQNKIKDLEITVNLLKCQIEEYDTSSKLQIREIRELRDKSRKLKEENTVLNNIICPSSQVSKFDEGSIKQDDESLQEQNTGKGKGKGKGKNKKETIPSNSDYRTFPDLRIGYQSQVSFESGLSDFEEEGRANQSTTHSVEKKDNTINENLELEQLKLKFKQLQIEIQEDSHPPMEGDILKKLIKEKRDHLNTISNTELILLKKDRTIHELKLNLQKNLNKLEDQYSLNGELLEVIENLNFRIEELQSQSQSTSANLNDNKSKKSGQNQDKGIDELEKAIEKMESDRYESSDNHDSGSKDEPPSYEYELQEQENEKPKGDHRKGKAKIRINGFDIPKNE